MSSSHHHTIDSNVCYFNCVVMGNEYLNPDSSVAHYLSQYFRFLSSKLSSKIKVMNDVDGTSSKRTSSKKSSTSNSNSIDELDCQFIVETTFAPKPFLLPISTEQLHCAIILFSPMRPLSFVRIDSFIDRVLHVQNLKIIILVVDVDVLGSEAAIASLNETSRCRPVSRSDLKQYVKLKRRLFNRIDEYEESARTAQQQQQGSFGAGGGGDGGRFAFGDNSSFAASAASDAKSRPSIVNKRELIVCVHQKHEWMKLASAISSSSTSSSSSSFLFSHSNIQLLSALKWCFGRQFGESVEKKIFGSTTTTNMITRNSISSSSPNKHDAVAAAEEHFGEHFESSSSSDDDDDDDENFIDKHTRENQQENEDGVSFNDVAWYLEWEHQLHQARQFYRQQKALFGDQSSSSRSSNKKWIMIPLQPKSSTTQAGQADSAEFAPASADFSSADFSSPVRRIGSAAFLLTPSSSSRHSFHQHQHRKSIVLSSSDHSVSPSPLSVTTTNRPAGETNVPTTINRQTEEQEKVQGEKTLPQSPPLRFAFWDPTTNQISLTIPKQIVADMQVQRFLEEANEKDTSASTQKAKQDDKALSNNNSASVASSSNDNTPPPEQDADNDNDDDDDDAQEKSPSLTNFLTKRSRSFSMMHNQNNSNSILEQQQKDISFYASCPPHQAKKALIMAGKLREESYREAEKNMTKRLQSLQEHLTNVEKKNRDLNHHWNELQQQRDELKLTREAVKEKVYQTQKNVMKLKLERDRIALLNHTSTSSSQTIDSNTNKNQQESLQYAITEAEHRLELLQNQLSGLSSWKSQQCKKQEAELLEYERSGGKQELIRQYYARFLENQQIRVDLNKIVERNDEIQSEIDVVRSDEFLPLFHRKKVLEGRKNQLLLEIHELVADDMVKEKNVNRFLEQVALRRRKREHEEKTNMMKDQTDEDNNFSSSLSSDSNSSLDSFSSSSSSDADFDENPEKPSPHLFQPVIHHLRQKLRSIQNSFRFDPVHLLKPIGICRSPALHQVIEKAEIIYVEKYENDQNSNHDWIAEFIRNSKQALDSMLYYSSSSSSSSSSARTSAVPINEMNLNLGREIVDRKMLLLTINEVIARQQLKCDEATRRMLVLQAAALVHTRNFSVKSIELAKAKRKALV